MIVFKFNNKSYPLPTCWEDVTYRQNVELLTAKGITDFISIFTEIPRGTLERAEIKGLERIAVALSFLSKAPKFNRTAMVGPYIMPMDVTIQSTGQFEDLRGLLSKIPKEPAPELLSDLYLEACAIYCQKLRDGKYDPTKVAGVKEELKDYSCMEVCGTGAFFLFRPVSLLQVTTNRFRTFFLRLKNTIRVLLGYRKILASPPRSFERREK